MVKKLKATGITSLGGGKYEVRVTALDPLTKKMRERRRVVEAESADEAEAIRDKIAVEFREELQEKNVGNGTETLREYGERWLSHLEKSGRNRSHVVERNRQDLQRLIYPVLGNVQVGSLTRRHVLYWMEESTKLRTRAGKQYSKESLRKGWRLLRSLLRDGVDLAGLPVGLTAEMRYRPSGKPVKDKDSLTSEELAAFVKASRLEPLAAQVMVLLGFTTGLRFGELSALEKTDVDLQRRVLYVNKSQVGGKIYLTKTEKPRELPIHDVVMELLELHLENVPGPLLFPNRGGGYRTNTYLRKILQRVCKNAKITKHVTPHTMRRTFNNLMRRGNVDKEVTMSMTGHSTEEMFRHYSRIEIDEKRAAQEQALTLALGPVRSGQDPA